MSWPGTRIPERPQLDGLSRAEAERLLQEVGANQITREASKPAWSLLLARFDSPMIWLSLAACVVSAALGEVADAIAIGAIVIIAGNVGELAVVFTAALAGLPAPLLPLHLL
jgi:magnesium-transporting ATPase (P-type)